MSQFINPIIYQIKRNQQENNLNNVSRRSLNLMDPEYNDISMITTAIHDFKEIDPKYLYILSPKKNLKPNEYTYIGVYNNKYLYIKNNLIYYTFPNNIDNLRNYNYIYQLIENNPYLLEINIPKRYGEFVINNFILKYETDEFYVYYKNYIEEFRLDRKNTEELNKIIEILKICQPPQLEIHNSYRNISQSLNTFLNQYYINHSSEYDVYEPSRYDYYTIKSYTIPNHLSEEEFKYLIQLLLKIKPYEIFNIPPIKSYRIPNNLTEEDFEYLILLLLEIKPYELYIPTDQYIFNFGSNYGKMLSPLLDFYNKKIYNINECSYYEKRNV